MERHRTGTFHVSTVIISAICSKSFYSAMSDAELNNSPRTIPVLLLKTKSSPGDGYEELFSSITDSGFVFEPRFLPVLEHGFKPEGVECIRKLLKARDIGPREECAYGGLIFTSQRAVEAFAAVVTAVQGLLGQQSAAFEGSGG